MADLQQKCATPPATRTTKQIEKPRRADTTTEYEERCRAKTQLAEFELNGVEIVTVDPGKASPKVLGKGAYGAVIELKFRGLKCAGKKLHDAFFDDVSSKEKIGILQRFVVECSLLAQLRHPHVVQFLGICYEHVYSTAPLLVMEYLPMTLLNCIEHRAMDSKILPDEIAYPILHDVALGLCYLHQRSPQVIHRDLSANNVLLTHDMTAKISDLGVAKILNLTAAKKTANPLTTGPGTPAYMPPEVWRNPPQYSIKVDIFSFGVLILHIFSGKWPLPGEQVTTDPNNPDKLIPKSEVQRREDYFRDMGESHQLMDLTKDCLHFTPEKRPDDLRIIKTIEESKAAMVPPPFNKLQLIEGMRELKEATLNLRVQITTLENQLETAEGKNKRERGIDSTSLSGSFTSSGGELAKHSFTKSGSYSIPYMSQVEVNTTIQLGNVPHPCQPGATLTWSKRCADLPVPMYHAEALVMGNTVYAGGGCAKDHSNTVFAYNIALDNWKSLPPCPVSYFGLAKLEERLVALGGITHSKGISDKVYTFDQGSQQWNSTLPNMLTARHSLSAITFESNIFACGGKDASGVSDSVEVLKAGSSQWYGTHPLPFPCYHMSSTVIHGCCYMLGGFDQHAFTDKVIYTSLTSLLEDSAITSKSRGHSLWHSLHSVRYTCAAAANVGGCLLAIGGGRTFGNAKVCMYCQFRKAWVKLTDLMDVHAYIGPTVAELPNSDVLVIGGATSSFEPRGTVYKGSISYGTA